MKFTYILSDYMRCGTLLDCTVTNKKAEEAKEKKYENILN